MNESVSKSGKSSDDIVAPTVEELLARTVSRLEQRVAELQDSCARFCGDNERLIKATGSTTVEDALKAIEGLKERVKFTRDFDSMKHRVAELERVHIESTKTIVNLNARMNFELERADKVEARVADLEQYRASVDEAWELRRRAEARVAELEAILKEQK